MIVKSMGKNRGDAKKNDGHFCFVNTVGLLSTKLVTLNLLFQSCYTNQKYRLKLYKYTYIIHFIFVGLYPDNPFFT